MVVWLQGYIAKLNQRFVRPHDLSVSVTEAMPFPLAGGLDESSPFRPARQEVYS